MISGTAIGIGAGAVVTGGGLSTGGGSAALSIWGTPPDGTVGQPYSFTPSVFGGEGARSFALTGTLPGGLSFDTGTGAITGTPSSAGTTSGLSITVTDSSGSAVLGPFSLSVLSAANFLAWASDALAWGSDNLAWG